MKNFINISQQLFDLAKPKTEDQFGPHLRSFIQDTYTEHALTIEDALLLYSLIRHIKPKVVVETGTYFGISSCWMACALRDNGFGKIFTFDIKDFSKDIWKKCEVENYITFIKGSIWENKDKLPNELDFVFIDSDHSEQTVLNEIGVVEPLVRKQGFIIVHDVTIGSQINPALLKTELKNWSKIYLPLVRGINIFQK